jgi:hypothetical protein
MTSSGVGPAAAAPVEVVSDHIHLVTMKPSPQGKGLLFRLAEESGHAGEALVRLGGLKPRAAHLASTHGEPLKPLPLDGDTVRVPLAPFGEATVLVE